jgi:hypothetical protein
MKTAENIKKVALIFFLILGMGHIISGLMVSNSYATSASLIVNRVLDIPFAMSALLYGISSIYMGINEKWLKIANKASIVISVLVFIVLIYINFLVPDIK